MDDLPAAFRAHWLRHFAPADGGRVVVAVSGGIDSMALLALLGRERAGGADLEVVAAHFDHGARGPEGAEDGRFVEAAGAAWGARVVRGAGDAPARAREGGRGPMAAARELRYRFLREVAEDEGAWAIATAHQRDDRVETLLLRIARGASVDGLGGPRAIDEWRGTTVIRPLLPFSRAAIAAWAGGAGVPFREDPSNADPRYPRTRLRNEVLPLLRELNPRIDAAVARLADLAAVDAAWLRSETDALLERATIARDDREWTLDAAALTPAPEAFLSRAVVAMWSWSAPEGAPPASAAWIEGAMDFLRGGRGGGVPAPGGGEIGRHGPEVVVRRAPERQRAPHQERATNTKFEDGEEPDRVTIPSSLERRSEHPSGRLERTLIDAETLRARVEELGAEIARDYANRDLVLLCLLKGGIYFTADLSRAIDLPITVEFVRARSYAGTSSSGEVKLSWIDGLDIAGRDVLIVEDIVDTGLTLIEIWKALEAQGPASLALCALLYKEKRLAHPFAVRYIGFAIEDVFVVGYGLDYDEGFRNLPHIAVFQPDESARSPSRQGRSPLDPP